MSQDNWLIIKTCAREILEQAENGRDLEKVAAWNSSLSHITQDEQREQEEAPVGAE